MSQPTSLADPQQSTDADFEHLEPSPPPDPAIIASGLMFRRASERLGLTPQDIGRKGSVALVTVADHTWAGPAHEAWRRDVMGGKFPDDGDRSYLSSSPRWVSWAPEARGRRGGPRREDDSFAEALGSGSHCIGIAHDVALLPPDLVQAADTTLVLEPLTPEDVVNIATMLGHGDAGPALTVDEAAAVTPRVLRLARRREQDARAYLLKLRQVLARERTTQVAAVRAKADSPREAPTLDRLFGMEEAVAWGRQLARDLGEFAAGRIPWAAVDRGALLSGPPGVGKTLFARALASTCGVPLVTGSYATWLGTGGGHQGDLLRNMRNTFREAREAGRAILFIDEVDSFPNRSTVNHHYRDWEVQVVNALLAELDGVEAREGVVVIGACNGPDLLDPALVRSGRLDRHIQVELPDREALARIMREHLGTDLSGVELSPVALAATGASGADVERMVRGARRRAREGGRALALADLMAEAGGADLRSEAERRVVATHEAGHAVAITLARPGGLLGVSLLRAACAASSKDSGNILDAASVRGLLVEVLAGRAAEEAIFGVASGGAGGSGTSDLARATYFAALLVGALGLDPEVGLVWHGLPDVADVPDLLARHPHLREPIGRILEESYGRALNLVRENRAAVHAVAEQLLLRRVLDGAEAEAIILRHSGGGRP